MRILDLFAGLGGERRRKFIEARGHEYVTLDNDPAFNCTITVDIFDMTAADFGYFDLVWASVPCEAFSIMSAGHHWTGGKKAYIPKTTEAKLSIELVRHTNRIIGGIAPNAWLIENPRGMLRKMPFMKAYLRSTITYCQYGDRNMKPTDLWGYVPGWTPRVMCANGRKCHDAAPRGSRLGIQGGISAAERAVVPLGLWSELLDVLEGNALPAGFVRQSYLMVSA